MAISKEAFESLQRGGKIIPFPRITREGLPAHVGDPDSDLYDSSREGTETFPQLARLILVKMIGDERIAGKGNARERATDRFLEFVSETSAISANLGLDDISKLTGRSPAVLSEHFKKKEEKSA